MFFKFVRSFGLQYINLEGENGFISILYGKALAGLETFSDHTHIVTGCGLHNRKVPYLVSMWSNLKIWKWVVRST